MRIALALAILLWATVSWAADAISKPDDNYSASKAMEIEVMRLRMGMTPSMDVSITIIEAEDVLRRYRLASSSDRENMKPQFDAIMNRLSLQMPR